MTNRKYTTPTIASDWADTHNTDMAVAVAVAIHAIAGSDRPTMITEAGTMFKGPRHWWRVEKAFTIAPSPADPLGGEPQVPDSGDYDEAGLNHQALHRPSHMVIIWRRPFSKTTTWETECALGPFMYAKSREHAPTE